MGLSPEDQSIGARANGGGGTDGSRTANHGRFHDFECNLEPVIADGQKLPIFRPKKIGSFCPSASPPHVLAFGMSKLPTRLFRVLLLSATAMALTPLRGQTVEEVCRDPGGKTNGARVRVSWTDVATTYDDVRITYCVLRGNNDAKLAFERDAEIVYFALANVDRKADRRKYTFTIRTSTGRVLRQGPALLQPNAKEPQSCRVDVCQFFTEPGERVVYVTVESADQADSK